MRNLWKAAAAAIALGTVMIAAPASAQNYGDESAPPPPYGDNGYGGYGYDANADCNPANYGPYDAVPPDCGTGGYCDQYGCPDDYYDMPVYYGPMFYDDTWFNGPLYYRDLYGRRQYWVHGGWHNDGWRGPRPSWWNASRYHTGPALGRGYYQNHSAFAGHANNGGGFNRGRYGNSQQGSASYGGGNRSYGGALDRRQSFGNSGQQGGYHGYSASGSFYTRNPNAGGGGGVHAQQSAPVQAAPQASGGGHYSGGESHGYSGGQSSSGGGQSSGGGGGGYHGGGGGGGGSWHR